MGVGVRARARASFNGTDMRISSSQLIKVSFHINYYVVVLTNFGVRERCSLRERRPLTPTMSEAVVK